MTFNTFVNVTEKSTYGANKTVNNAYLLGMEKHEVDCKELHGNTEILDG